MGAEWRECLDADDIDSALEVIREGARKNNKVEFLSAWQFFRARSCGADALKALGVAVSKRLEKSSYVVMPTHTRYHWLTTVVRSSRPGVDALVYDSAPSAPVHRDMRAFLRAMFGNVNVRFGAFPRQLRGSNQCGLFCILACLAAWRNDGEVTWSGREGKHVDLHVWRSIMTDDADLDEKIKRLSDAVPDVADMITMSSITDPKGDQSKTEECRGEEATRESLTKPLAVGNANTHQADTESCGAGSVKTPSAAKSGNLNGIPDSLPQRDVKPCRAASDIKPSNPTANSVGNPQADEKPWAAGSVTELRTEKGGEIVEMLASGNPPCVPLPTEAAKIAGSRRAVTNAVKEGVIDADDPLEYTGVDIVTDEDEATTFAMKAREMKTSIVFTKEELRLLDVAVRKRWQEWKREEDEQMAAIVRERDALHPAARAKRACEFRRRLTRTCPGDPDDLCVPLKLPDGKHVLMGAISESMCERILQLAIRCVRAKRIEEAKAHIDELTRSVAVGCQINSSVIEACLHAGLRDSSIDAEWTFIDTLDFQRFCGGRDVGLPSSIKNNVATIPCDIHHYTLVTAQYQDSAWTLRVFDSLNPPTYNGSHLRSLGCLRSFIASRTGLPIRSIKVANKPERVPQQATNDCGLEALRNLCCTVKGHRGSFERAAFKHILQAHTSVQALRESRLWDGLWNQTPVVSTKAEKKANTRRNDPYAAVVAPVENAHPHGQFDLSKSATIPKKAIRVEDPGLDRRELRRQLEQIPTRNIVHVPWKAFGEQGTWLGELTRKFATPGLPAQIRFFAEWCSKCNEWHHWMNGTATDDTAGEVFDIPLFPSVQYGRISDWTDRLTLIDITPNCGQFEDGDEQDSDVHEEKAETSRKNVCEEMRHYMADRDMEPLGTQSPENPLLSRASALKGIFIFEGKPPHIHNVVWNRRAKSTRAAHIRWLKHLRVMDEEIARLELPKAIVEFVLRWARRDGRSTRWSTVSSYMSSIGSAIECLSLYSNHADVRIRESKYFKDAVAFAAVKAREENAANATQITPMTLATFQKLIADTNDPQAQALLVMSWYFAGRVGDMRRIQRRNIKVSDERPDGTSIVKILVTEGKSVTWSGPYWLAARVPTKWATRWAEIARCTPNSMHMFDEKTQKVLSTICASLRNEVERISLRSIRKGALIYHRTNGVSLPDLQILAHHGSCRTLQRYLGWGDDDANILEAADRRHELEESTKGGGQHPMWMGLNSGTVDKKGQRMQVPPEFCPMKPPSRADLGLDDNDMDEDFALHIGDPGSEISFEAAQSIVQSAELRNQLQQVLEWMTSPRNYGVTWPPMCAKQIPKMRFSVDDERQFISKRKLRAFSGIIRSASKGFGHKERRKRRIRPVFETLINGSIDRSKLPELKYPSRYERRLRASKGKYFVHYDFAAYYDQFVIPEHMGEYFVVRGNEGLYTLTKLPMGCSFSAHVAQVMTWVILEPILRRAQETGLIEVVSCIDNVAFSSDHEGQIVWAVKTFKERATRVGAAIKVECDKLRLLHNEFCEAHNLPVSSPISLEKLEEERKKFLKGSRIDNNDILVFADLYRCEIDDSVAEVREGSYVMPRKDLQQHVQSIMSTVISPAHDCEADLLDWAKRRARICHEFLGEELHRVNDLPYVRNAARHLDKLREAYEKLQSALMDPSVTMSARNVASIIGFVNWLALTVNMKLRDHIELTRLFTTIGRCTKDQGWDGPWRITAHQVSTIGKAVGILLKNEWVRIKPFTLPSQDDSAYELTAIIDASKSGWACIARLRDGSIVEVRSGWPYEMNFSAHAEPKAVVEFLRYAHHLKWCKPGDKIAIVTDHEAIPSKQERVWKKTGGFSSAFWINEAFCACDRTGVDCQFFYVEGPKNPIDQASRSSHVGDPTRHVYLSTVRFPSLCEFHHPYIEREPISWWQR